MKKNQYRCILNVMSYLIAILCFMSCAVHAKAVVKNAASTEPQDTVSGTADETGVGMHYQVKIDHPFFEKEPSLNAVLTAIIQQHIGAFNKEVFSEKTPIMPRVGTFDIKNGTVYEDEEYISFILSMYQFTGGAHGSTALIPVTYSKRTKKLLSLEEAIQPVRKDWLKMLSDEVRRQLTAQLEKKLFASDEEWIKNGTEPTEENFKVFALEKDAVRIIFNQYQVGPYSSGIKEVVVPLMRFK